jgi:prepilin-type N-terminal cleavage/methylation domain-containing protein
MLNFALKLWLSTRSFIKKRPGNRGFTLVESLVAISILGVSAAAFISSLSSGSLAVRTLDEQVTTQQLLQTQMEVIKAAAYDLNGVSYTRIATPAEYTLNVAVALINSDSHIQKVTLSAYHNGSLAGTLENYKVER